MTEQKEEKKFQTAWQSYTSNCVLSSQCIFLISHGNYDNKMGSTERQPKSKGVEGIGGGGTSMFSRLPSRRPDACINALSLQNLSKTDFSI